MKALLIPVANFLVYQLGWFGSIYAAADKHYELVLLISCALSGLFFVQSATRRSALISGLAFAMTGLVADTILIHTGSLSPIGAGITSPVWLISMWCVFGVAADDGLRKLLDRPLVFGVLGGPLVAFSYSAAGRLGAAEPQVLNDSVATALVWAVGIFVCAFAIQRIKK